MLIKCEVLFKGPGPSETVVSVKTEDGVDEVAVYENSLRDGRLEVGKILSVRGNYSLVELPREAASGKWRVWVSSNDVLETA